jgi:hypothetical protein
MRKLNFYLLAAITGIVFTFTSCEKEVIKEVEVPVITEVQRVSFEQVELNEDGYQNNFPDKLILSDVDFYNYASSFSWEGFAVSRNTDKETAGYANEYSVYANGGANNSQQFAVAYAGFNETTYCKFPERQEYTFKGLMINNTTNTALSIKNGDDFAKKFEAGDWFKIIITGFNANGTETGKVEFYLADFRAGKSFICSEWTAVNLSGLGKVNKLEFTFESSDTSTFGDDTYINTPTYACIDDIVYYAK